MKFHPSLFLAVLVSLGGLPSLRAQVMSSPVNDLAKKLSEDPREREAAGKRLEIFMLTPDASGRSFVSADADHAALGAMARDWAKKTEPGRLALLIFVCTPESKGEARLRAALADWAGKNQIGKTSGASQAAAFLNDAEEKAGQVFGDPRTRAEIDAAISANEAAAPAVPGAGKSIERAGKLRESAILRDASVFGPDREAQEINPTPNPGAPTGAGAGAYGRRLSQNGHELWGGAKSSLDAGVVPGPADEIAIANRRRALEALGITEKRSPEAFRAAMASPVSDVERGEALKNTRGGTYGAQLRESGHEFWGGALSFGEGLGEGLLNPLMYVIPGIGRTLSRSSALAIGPAAGAYIVTPLKSMMLPDPLARPEQGGGAVMEARVVTAADKNRSSQGYLSGVIEFQKGDFEKADALWKNAVALDPGNADAAAGLDKIKKLKAPVK